MNPFLAGMSVIYHQEDILAFKIVITSFLFMRFLILQMKKGKRIFLRRSVINNEEGFSQAA